MKGLLKTGSVGVAVIALCGAVSGCGQKSEQTTVQTPAPEAAARQPAAAASGAVTNATPVSAPALKPAFQKLIGKWERPDGGYVLEIKSIDPEGKIEAGYFNPNPINVARAAAAQDSEGTKLMVELRDDNYPGCIYRLKYDSKADQLFGTYYQAAMDQTYDVAFARLPQ